MNHSLLKYLFNLAIEKADEAPVVIFFDEADQIFGRSSTDEHTMKQQAAIKDLWDGILRVNKEIYVFAATNHPRRIELADFNRRLPARWHVKPPGQPGRKRILRSTIEMIQQPMTEEDLDDVADRFAGFTADDIQSIVKKARSKVYRALRTATKWTEVNMRGRVLLMPHEGSESVAKDCQLRQDMERHDRERCVRRPVSRETLI